MSKIKIETITNVHIGSGKIFYLNNDFCVATDYEGYQVFGIIEPRRILNLIGTEHLSSWIRIIEQKRPIFGLIKQYQPRATVEEYTSRTIDLSPSCDISMNTLKECIHDGLGRLYIPGSSIKGAVRTAVLASIAAALRPNDIQIGNNQHPSAYPMESRYLGNSPFTDVFRFLQVGDAFFEYDTVALTMVNINERRRQDFWDESHAQNIETIAAGCETTFDMKLKGDYHNFCAHEVHNIPPCMSSLPELFNSINNHIISLLNSEIDHWSDLANRDQTHKVDKYVEECERVLQEAKKCKEGKECILRVGHGGGWRFVTGAWGERSTHFHDAIVPQARPRNQLYVEYDFPKSRRVAKDCSLLGFVKLTIY